ncbi:MAG: hypothetical protein H8Z69_00985 [Nanohaloarchaea archaeon]|nr:hypothetical protein [Candidatus Nanohaloarchaea archaeon]
MLDGKILAAVLATLTAVAAGTGGGSVDTQGLVPDVPETPEVSGLNGPIEKITSFFNSVPEPERSLEAELKIISMYEDTIKLDGTSLEASNLTDIKADGNRIKSDSYMTLRGFKGKLNAGQNTTLEGKISGMTTSGVNLTGKMKINERMHSEKIRMFNVKKTPLKFAEVQGSVSSNDAFTRFRSGSRSLNLNSFKGNITVYPENKTMYLDGKVDKLSYGNFSYGS